MTNCEDCMAVTAECFNNLPYSKNVASNLFYQQPECYAMKCLASSLHEEMSLHEQLYVHLLETKPTGFSTMYL